MINKKERAIGILASMIIVAGALMAHPGVATARVGDECHSFDACAVFQQDLACDDSTFNKAEKKEVCWDVAFRLYNCVSNPGSWAPGECTEFQEEGACQFDPLELPVWGNYFWMECDLQNL